MKWTTLLLLAITVFYSGCKKSSYEVVNIIDGDTIIVKPYLPVRIIGIDAPEINKDSQKFKDDVEYYKTNSDQELKLALESKKELQDLLLHKKVILKAAPNLDYETQENGRTGRALRFVYLSNEDIGKSMLQKGYARIVNKATLPNTYSHQKEKEYNAEENIAKNLEKGVWESTPIPILKEEEK